MFEAAELDHVISKEDYEKQANSLRQALLEAQLELVEKKEFSVAIIMSGFDGGGRSDTINLLNAWMDARHVQTFGEPRPTEEETHRPWLWRFWRALPPKGKVGIFYTSWYGEPLRQRMLKQMGKGKFHHAMDEILQLEKMLAQENVLVLKFWFHMSQPQQRSRLKQLEADPKTRWRVSKVDWKRFKTYECFKTLAESMIRRTDSAEAPWMVISGRDARYRHLTVGRILVDAIRKRLDTPRPVSAGHLPPLPPQLDGLNVLKSLTLFQPMKKQVYETELEYLQGRLNRLTRHPEFANWSVLMVFEGNDAAGKGGSIRRMTEALDARIYKVIPIAAPTDEEKAQPYLWRFWRHVPSNGHIVIFDRSWYGRVLVERIEGFCSEAAWKRAYGEINEFERQLAEHKTLVIKFWLAISADEQMRRFKERETIGFKRFKITEEDWRNREKWAEYEDAVCDMVERTSTRHAPWTLVEADNKRFARIKILRTVCEALEKQLNASRKNQN